MDIHQVQWSESRVDVAELAKLRWIEGWTYEKLSLHYGRTFNAINNDCQKIRKKNFDVAGLTYKERSKIRRSF